MSKVKPEVMKDQAEVFEALREQLGPREKVAPLMGTNRITLYRWENRIHPIPPMAFVCLGLLREKFPQGLPGGAPVH